MLLEWQRAKDPYAELIVIVTTWMTNYFNSFLEARTQNSLFNFHFLSQLVYDKDKFSADDRMGEAEIDIQPLVSAAKAYENSTITESMQLGKWLATEDNTLVKDSIISLIDGKVKQEITLRLQNVERGELEIELECVPLSQ